MMPENGIPQFNQLPCSKNIVQVGGVSVWLAMLTAVFAALTTVGKDEWRNVCPVVWCKAA